MNFELGKSYIVDVTEKGIIPLQEFDSSKWYNKDYDDLDFLTDEEKINVVNKVLDELRAEIEQIQGKKHLASSEFGNYYTYETIDKADVLEIIDKYQKRSEE